MNEKLHSFHLAILIYLIQTGVTLFVLPAELAQNFGTNGWVAVIIGAALVYINIFLIGAVYRLGRGKSFFAIIEDGMPPMLSYTLYLLLTVLWSLIGCITAKQYIMVYQIITFQHTPGSLLKLGYDVLIYTLVIKGIYNIAKASTFIFSITVFLALLFFYFITDIELARYTPFLFKDGDGLLIGIFKTYIAFLGFELSILFFPYINKESKFFTSLIIGNLITTVVYVYTCLIIFGVFGYEYLKELIFPLLDFLSIIRLPIIERLENLLYALFALKVLITSVMFYWAATESAKRIFRNKSDKTLSFILIAFSYFISLIPDSLEQVRNWLDFLTRWEIGVTLFLPVICIILILLRSKGRKHADGKNC
ncbi:spore gernimation protein [Peribacillus saganii]|uniref:Spore gernimation protein n=1 Tax=Peribacillus saganii TaxID=2303992 RepID=A0A372LMC8_9BACI|nr:endospore germination permease [Peribacillus saganii]RFU67691.1 spore gernimation protein [Peribacillus saganii]